jgi:hypothetical protein
LAGVCGLREGVEGVVCVIDGGREGEGEVGDGEGEDGWLSLVLLRLVEGLVVGTAGAGDVSPLRNLARLAVSSATPEEFRGGLLLLFGQLPCFCLLRTILGLRRAGRRGVKRSG